MTQVFFFSFFFINYWIHPFFSFLISLQLTERSPFKKTIVKEGKGKTIVKEGKGGVVVLKRQCLVIKKKKGGLPF